MFKKIILAAALLVSINLLAHEGHNDAPGALKANHGGTVKAGKEINLEYVVSGTEVKLYPVSHDGKDLNTNEVKFTATTKLPKGKAQPISLGIKDGAYWANVDFKDAFRVEMTVNSNHKGKTDNFKFQIEK